MPRRPAAAAVRAPVECLDKGGIQRQRRVRFAAGAPTEFLVVVGKLHVDPLRQLGIHAGPTHGWIQRAAHAQNGIADRLAFQALTMVAPVEFILRIFG